MASCWNAGRLQRRGDRIGDLGALRVGRLLVGPISNEADLHGYGIGRGIGIGAGGHGDGAVIFADHDLLRVGGDRYRRQENSGDAVSMRWAWCKLLYGRSIRNCSVKLAPAAAQTST